MATIPTLQIPSYAPEQAMEWTTLSKLGDAYRDGRQRRTLADLANTAGVDGKLDYNKASLQLLASGDKAGAMSLAQLGMNQAQQEYGRSRDTANDQWKREEAARSQGNWEKTYGLQAQAAARAGEDKYVIKEVSNSDGSTGLVRIPTRGAPGVIDTGLPQSAVGNPFASGKFNEGQGKAAGFTDRMLQSEGILSGVNGQGGVQGQGTSVYGAVLDSAGNAPYVGGVTGAIANWMKPEDRQRFEQAKRDFVNAQLRRESGAAISASEFESANKQYFPMPGDSAAVIQQKAANRRSAIEAMGREGGPSYRPKFMFNEKGNVVPHGGQQPRAAQPQQFRDGQRARGTDGRIIEYRGGQWVPAQ